jgi:anti-anti-sigma factor
VVPYGDLDLATVDRVRHAIDSLVDADFADIVLDLRNLWFMDSSGLNLVIRYSQRDDVHFRVIPGAENVTRVFTAAGVRDAIRFVAAADL